MRPVAGGAFGGGALPVGHAGFRANFFVAFEAIGAGGEDPFHSFFRREEVMTLEAVDEGHLVPHCRLICVTGDADTFRPGDVMNPLVVAIEALDPGPVDVDLMSRRFPDIMPPLGIRRVAPDAHGVIEFRVVDHLVGTEGDIHPELFETLDLTMSVAFVAVDHRVRPNLPLLERFCHRVATHAKFRLMFDVMIGHYAGGTEGGNNARHDQAGDPELWPAKPLEQSFHRGSRARGSDNS